MLVTKDVGTKRGVIGVFGVNAHGLCSGWQAIGRRAWWSEWTIVPLSPQLYLVFYTPLVAACIFESKWWLEAARQGGRDTNIFCFDGMLSPMRL